MDLSELDQQLSDLAGADVDLAALVAGLLGAQGLRAPLSLEAVDAALTALADGVVEGAADALSVDVPVPTSTSDRPSEPAPSESASSERLSSAPASPELASPELTSPELASPERHSSEPLGGGRVSSIPAGDPARAEQELDALLGLDYADPSSLPPGARPLSLEEPARASDAEPESDTGARDTWSDPVPLSGAGLEPDLDDLADDEVVAATDLSATVVDQAAPVLDPSADQLVDGPELAEPIEAGGPVDGQAAGGPVDGQAAAGPDAGHEMPGPTDPVEAAAPVEPIAVTLSEPPVTGARAPRDRRDTLEDRPRVSRPSPAAKVDDAEIEAILSANLAEGDDGLDLPAAEGNAVPAASQPSLPPPLPASGPPKVSVPPPLPGLSASGPPASSPPGEPVAASADEDDDSFELLIDDEDVLELDDEELELLED